jgi:hypothetical protein
MNEADVQRKLCHAFRSAGYWDITQTDAAQCPSCGTLTHPKTGRPDVLLLHPHQASRVCEVKALRAGETSFPFSRIEDKQRKWQERWMDDGGLGYIGLGVIRQHGKRQHLDHLYLVDWASWLDIEGLVRQIQDSIPYQAGSGYAKELQEKQWDIIHLLADYEVSRRNRKWVLPEESTIYAT